MSAPQFWLICVCCFSFKGLFRLFPMWGRSGSKCKSNTKFAFLKLFRLQCQFSYFMFGGHWTLICRWKGEILPLSICCWHVLLTTESPGLDQAHTHAFFTSQSSLIIFGLSLHSLDTEGAPFSQILHICVRHWVSVQNCNLRVSSWCFCPSVCLWFQYYMFL